MYLIGAGASHASVKFVGSQTGILMRDLWDPLITEIGGLVRSRRKKYAPLESLVNDISGNDSEVDIEHIITFLEESPSAVHRDFAQAVRRLFAKVLRAQLSKIKRDLGDERFILYSALLDMYRIKELPERLRGILSLNYDDYIECAARRVYRKPVDRGVNASFGARPTDRQSVGLRLLKLHGSFDWKDTWPIVLSRGSDMRLWIPPGIHKEKDGYPFSLLWGRAREMLDCDVLRIIGCRLSANDWDLISLLFTTRHGTMSSRARYTIEVIDRPRSVDSLKAAYPYLDIRSIFDIDEPDIGPRFVSDMLDREPISFRYLDEAERKRATERADEMNWFHQWLVHMADALSDSLSIATPSGHFERVVNGGAL